MRITVAIVCSTLFLSTFLFCQRANEKFAHPKGFRVVHSSLVRAQVPVNQESERELVARTISSVIGWAKEKNLGLFYSVICHDTDYVSVSPGKKVVKCFEDVKQNVPFWMSPDFKYVRHELRDLRVTFSRRGDVAWFYCVLDDVNTYKGEPASWENTRWTGVLEKRDGVWVVVQQHFSFAAD